jgi:hypothetical protein
MNLAKYTSELPVTEEWLAELPVDRYRPMLRLLQEDDWRFLREQQGFRLEIEKRLREQRVQVFQAYLAILETDFRRMCRGLGQRGAEGVLLRKAAFRWRMTAVRASLALYRAGLARVDASGLVSLFDETRGALSKAATGLVRVAA